MGIRQFSIAYEMLMSTIAYDFDFLFVNLFVCSFVQSLWRWEKKNNILTTQVQRRLVQQACTKIITSNKKDETK